MPDDSLRTKMIGGVPCCRPATRSPASVLGWSEARVDENASRGPSIALWVPEGTRVAIGIGQKPEVELDADAMEWDGVGLIRRQSGGGAVLLYPGVLCWEAWTSKQQLEKNAGPEGSDIRQAYAALCRPVVMGLHLLDIEAFHAGICDVSTHPAGMENPRKLAGTAQLRRRDMVLVHGSLLVSPDLELLSRYLKFPSEQPEYRRNRSHRDFCVTVSELLRTPHAGPPLISRVAGAIVTAAQLEGWETFTPPECLDPAAEKLKMEKYSSADWNWKKIRPAATV